MTSVKTPDSTPSSYRCGCCGIIVFSPDQTKIAMVKTPKGHWGYPKGKRHQGETDLECAFRELEEETGLQADQLDLVDQEKFNSEQGWQTWTVDELSKRGNPNIRYFVALLKKEYWSNTGSGPKLRCADPDELAEVVWVPVDKVLLLENLKEARKNVFRQIMDELATE